MAKRPTIRQMWVLYSIHPLTMGNLYTLAYTKYNPPLGRYTKAQAIGFMDRMVKAGWLDYDSQESYYNLTYEAMVWLKENPEPKNFSKILAEKKLIIQ